MQPANEQNNQVPIQCQDDPYGFRAEVVYGDGSFPLRRCTPFIHSPPPEDGSREPQGSALYRNPVINEEIVDNQDVVADGTILLSSRDNLSIQLHKLQGKKHTAL